MQGFFLAFILFCITYRKYYIMKHFFSSLSVLFVFTLFTGCGSNQKLQKKAPANFQQAYYTKDASAIKLFIPVSAIQTERVTLNSVYFQDRKADLEFDNNHPGVYVATFPIGKQDLIMSSDPKDEYENKVRAVPQEAPVEIKDDEAILVFTERGDIKFYKIKGIEQRSAE